MSESVLITDTRLDAPGPHIIYVNPAFEKMTGWTREEVIGKSPRVLQGPKTDHSIFADLRDKLSRGESWTGRTVNYRRDGSPFHMEWSITPVRDARGEMYQYLAVQKEVSQIVRTEMQLQEAMQVARNRLMELQKTNEKLNRLVAHQNKTLALFKKYVPEAIIDKALSEDNVDIRAGEELEVALLFCDIRGFTAIAEQLSPDQVVELLNTFYTGMSEVIIEYGGEINEFTGDEIFVAFGAPLPIAKPELSSVRCALAMIDNLKSINQSLKKKLNLEITVGIGINYGPVIAGNLGSQHKLEYSITGSPVITAKRIESLTVDRPNTIFISRSIYDQVHSHVNTRPYGKVLIKGKNEKIDVFEVLVG
ncbi:MAG: adenylate/guanylate cyclase domain-containing protein [Saprospiraceae bacterium]|nr:adenylate/guanylate cyclase domain-containing protein [Saprospiraceae bacterium]